MQEENAVPCKIKVIVRAWGDEPVCLFMHSIDSKAVYVGQQLSEMVIGLPHEQVFLFDEIDFCALKDAFACGNVDKLHSIYSRLEINSPCRKYSLKEL